MKLYSDQVRAWVPARYEVLGTDGYGRSDTRERLRSFFEVDRYHVVISALTALARDGEIEQKKVLEAMREYDIDRNKPNPAIS